MRIAIFGLVFMSLISACSVSSDSKKDKWSLSKGDGSGNLNGTYKYESNGCSTGEHAYSSKNDLCQKLRDEALNKGCAYELRQLEIKQTCPATPKAAPVANAPVPVPAPVPPPVPAHATCFKPADAAPKGTEITLEDFADGSAGRYRMVSMTGMILTNFRPVQMSLKVLTTASTDADEKAAALIACKELSDAPEGKLEGNFKVPRELRRDGGIIHGGIRSHFLVYGAKLRIEEQIESFKTDSMEASSLTELSAQLAKTGGTLNIYQQTDGSIQLIVRGETTNQNVTTSTIMSATYKPIAVSAVITPAPVRPAAPPPVLPANEQTKAVVEKFCQEYSYSSDKLACMVKIKDASFPKEVEVCGEFSYTNDKVACAMKLQQKTFAAGIGKLCSEFSYTNDKLSCLLKLADVQLSQAQIKVCSEFSYTNDKVACVLKLK